MKYDKVDKFTMTEVLNKKTGNKHFVYAVHIIKPDDWGPYKNNITFYHIKEKRVVGSFISDTSLKRDYKMLKTDKTKYEAMAAFFKVLFNHYDSETYAVDRFAIWETAQ